MAFNGEHAIQECLQDIAAGDTTPWAADVPYYRTANYGWRLQNRRFAVVNACAYRSRGVPAPAVVEDLPSARMTRMWLLNALIPLVRNRQRLIVAWRPRLWGADCERTLAMLRITASSIPTPAASTFSSTRLRKPTGFLAGHTARRHSRADAALVAHAVPALSPASRTSPSRSRIPTAESHGRGRD